MMYDNMTDSELIQLADKHYGNSLIVALAERLDMRQQPQSVFHDQAHFMHACGQTTTKPNATQSDMYLELIQEEGEELVVALQECDVVEELDAIIDLLVVIIGYGLSRGFPMVEAWDEVLRSNMAKIDPLTGTVLRREDGKILKPAGWTAPDLDRVLHEHDAI
jgi:predicted HAD superfamily Cof-like phosphohydrolase